MDIEAFGKTVRATESLVIESGPYTGLSLGQAMKDCPDIAYNSGLVRGRGQAAQTSRAYFKMLKAQDELVAALKACDPAQTRPSPKPTRNIKTPVFSVSITETLALVPYQGKQTPKRHDPMWTGRASTSRKKTRETYKPEA